MRFYCLATVKLACPEGKIAWDGEKENARFQKMPQPFAVTGVAIKYCRNSFIINPLQHTSKADDRQGSPHETRLPIYEAIKGLHRVLGRTQICAQLSGAVGQNGAQRDAAGEGMKTAKTLVNSGSCHGLAHTAAGRNWSE